MPRKAREVRRGLRRKGFRETDSRHRKLEYYKLNGQEGGVNTLMSHGSERDLGDHLLGQMARQIHLTRRQFDDLIDCRLSQADYEAMLRRDGMIR